MFDFAEMSRVANAIESLGTLNSKTLTIAFMEFLESGDSNLMKSLWLSHGFEDISPLWGHESRVPSFKESPATIAQWRDFQKEMTQVEADWYYLSGHHGRQYSADDESYETLMDQYNYLGRAGFFNEPYHDGRWDRANQYDEYAGQTDRDVFMWSSTDEWSDPYEPGPEDNPLYGGTHDSCRGVMLIGCNTLAYRSAREMYNTYFPNAVIIGLISRENCAINRITKLCQDLGRDFFVDPTQFDPEDLVQRLNPSIGEFDNMALQSAGVLYWKRGDGVRSKDATDVINPEDR